MSEKEPCEDATMELTSLWDKPFKFVWNVSFDTIFLKLHNIVSVYLVTSVVHDVRGQDRYDR